MTITPIDLIYIKNHPEKPANEIGRRINLSRWVVEKWARKLATQGYFGAYEDLKANK